MNAVLRSTSVVTIAFVGYGDESPLLFADKLDRRHRNKRNRRRWRRAWGQHPPRCSYQRDAPYSQAQYAYRSKCEGRVDGRCVRCGGICNQPILFVCSSSIKAKGEGSRKEESSLACKELGTRKARTDVAGVERPARVNFVDRERGDFLHGQCENFGQSVLVI